MSDSTATHSLRTASRFRIRFLYLERIPFNHSVSDSVILGPNGPGNATVNLDTGLCCDADKTANQI